MPLEPYLTLPIQASVVRYRLGMRGFPRPLDPRPRNPQTSVVRYPLGMRVFPRPPASPPASLPENPPSWGGREVPEGFFLVAPTIDTPVIDPVTGDTVNFLRNPPSDQDPGNPPGQVSPEGCPPNFGPDPNDPAGFSSQIDPRSAVCSLLSSYAMAACMRRGRYF
jgi:hypothetical protein